MTSPRGRVPWYGAGLLEHGRKAEEVAMGGLVNDNLLLVLVDRGDAHPPRQHHVGLPADVPAFVDAFAGRKMFEFHLSGEHCGFIVVQQRKERHAAQHIGLQVIEGSSIAGK